MVYLEQVLPPYFATPADCSLRQRYPYHPIPYQHNQGWEGEGFRRRALYGNECLILRRRANLWFTDFRYRMFHVFGPRKVGG